MIIEIDQLAALRPWKAQWEALLEATPGASFFHTPAWVECYWHYFGRQQQLCCLLEVEGARLRGVVPLAIRREKTRLGRLRVLGYVVDGWSDFYGPIGPHPEATLTAALNHVRGRKRDWDLLDLRHVAAHRQCGAATRRALETARLPFDVRPWETIVEIDLETGWDAYWASRSSKHRNNVRRSLKKMSELGEVTLLSHAPQGEARGDGQPNWPLFELCQQAAQRSWQAERTDGTTLSSPAIADFLREAHAHAARWGCVAMHVLTAGGAPLAFAYNYRFGGDVFGLRMGYDEAFRGYSPGVALLWHMLQFYDQQAVRRLSLGPASSRAKRAWGTTRVCSYHYCHFPRGSWRSQLLRLKRNWVGQGLASEAVGIKTRVDAAPVPGTSPAASPRWLNS